MNRVNIQWTAKTLSRQMEAGKVNFDNAVQRSLVWDDSRKSLLIHSMVYGYAIPAMYFTKDEDGIYDSLDGKQRSNAISSFLHDEFALTVDTPPVFDDDGNQEDISGLSFSQLPEWAQDRIKDYSLTIYYYEDMTEQEIKEFFRRLNNGKALSSVELTRVNTPDIQKFQSLASHPAIQSVVSAAGKKRFTDENIAMQIYHIATEDEPDFSTKTFREWAKSVQANDAVIENIKIGLEAFQQFFDGLDATNNKKIIRTVKARTHFVSSVLYCYLAKVNGVSQERIIETLLHFFSGSPSVDEEYNKTVGSGSAKPGAVQARQKAMRRLVKEAQNEVD